MIDFKLIRTVLALPSLTIGLFTSIHVFPFPAAWKQNVKALDQMHPTNSSIGIANQLSQRLVSTQATKVLFCISGDIPQSTCFTATDLAQLPRTTLIVRSRDGIGVVYEGVANSCEAPI